MKSRKINLDQLKVMRNHLPQGSNRIIAGKTGLTPVYISKVLHGVHLNIDVIEEALKLALEVKSKTDTINEKLDSAFKK